MYTYTPTHTHTDCSSIFVSMSVAHWVLLYPTPTKGPIRSFDPLESPFRTFAPLISIILEPGWDMQWCDAISVHGFWTKVDANYTSMLALSINNVVWQSQMWTCFFSPRKIRQSNNPSNFIPELVSRTSLLSFPTVRRVENMLNSFDTQNFRRPIRTKRDEMMATIATTTAVRPRWQDEDDDIQWLFAIRIN